ncbi:MAG: DNA sulfur modification protein DndB [Deltaproteobacteria bacterium]|nr:DNA sulfur modification protein DndB [Kofleriaceae bacterium]
MDPSYGYAFPAISGVQAQREYYISMCPLRLIPRIFLFDEEELVPELRAQRTLNKARLPELSQYIVGNPKDYVFSSITASIDGEVKFDSLGKAGDAKRIGVLRVPMSARFVINDGQHRRAAIELALRENPELGDETISVVFFMDVGLKRCQQMFADLNRNAIRPSKSLGVLYDHRDDLAQIVRSVTIGVPLFKDLVEMERSTLSLRSRRLFTLSALYGATRSLLSNLTLPSKEESTKVAREFWEEVVEQFPEWGRVQSGKLAAGDIRVDFIHSHGIALHALGRAGNALLHEGGAWRKRLKLLRKMDWSRSNAALWEGRAMVAGRVCKSGNNLTLTTNVIKKQLGLELTPDEVRVEEAFKRGEHGDKNWQAA